MIGKKKLWRFLRRIGCLQRVLKGEVYYCKLTEITTCECCKQKVETFVDALGDFYGLAHLEKALKEVFNLKEFKHVLGARL